MHGGRDGARIRQTCGRWRCHAPPPATHKETTMTKLTTGLAMVAALLAGGLFAVPALRREGAQPTMPACCRSSTRPSCSRPSGIKQAEQQMSGTQVRPRPALHRGYVQDDPGRPEGRATMRRRTRRRRSSRTGPRSVATGDKAKGPYVLICTARRASRWSSTRRREPRVHHRTTRTSSAKIFDTALKDRPARSRTTEQKRDPRRGAARRDRLRRQRPEAARKVVDHDGKPRRRPRATRKKAGG